MSAGEDKPLSPEVVTEPNTVDVEGAGLDASLSKAGVDSTGEQFYATADRILFQSPLAVARTVLQTQGFVVNFENLLSCVDQMTVGAVIKASGKTGKDGLPRAKSVLPALAFKLPAKQRVGELLGLFYKEIELYEAELLKVRADAAKADASDMPQTQKDLQAELRRLREANGALAMQFEEMAGRLGELARHKAAAEQSLEAGQVMPPSIHAGAVRGVHWDDRTVTIRTGHGTHTVFMAELESVPESGTPCLLEVTESGTPSVLFYGVAVTRPRPLAATILYTSGHTFKARDHARDTHVVTARNKAELAQLETLRRGSAIVLYFAGSRLMKFLPLAPDEGAAIVARVRAESVTRMIDAATLEASVHDWDQRDEEAA